MLIPILGRFTHNGQLGIGPIRPPTTLAKLSRGKGNVPKDREVCLCPSHLDLETPTILPSSQYNSCNRSVLEESYTSRRLIQWSIELCKFDIAYHPRTAIKGQAMPNFVVEFNLCGGGREVSKKCSRNKHGPSMPTVPKTTKRVVSALS